MACPYCGASVEEQGERCSGCGVLLLYGLVAPAHRDPQVQDRVAAVLGALPGGPGRLEGRRRVREGLPLIVGLSRRRTEELQGRLVDLGLIPRIGPAPRGTAPFEPEHHGLVGRVILALAIPVLAFAAFRLLEPEPTPPRPAAEATSAGEARGAPERPTVELNAGIERERHGHMWLVLAARARSEGPPPEADVILRLRDETETVIWTGSVSTHGARDISLRAGETVQTLRTVHGRTSLAAVRLEAGERLTLEASWQGLESARTHIEVPQPVAHR